MARSVGEDAVRLDDSGGPTRTREIARLEAPSTRSGLEKAGRGTSSASDGRCLRAGHEIRPSNEAPRGHRPRRSWVCLRVERTEPATKPWPGHEILQYLQRGISISIAAAQEHRDPPGAGHIRRWKVRQLLPRVGRGEDEARPIAARTILGRFDK